MNERRATAIAIVVAISSTLFRLVTLQWLHPLNWDELEFYRAARWIAEGRVPFRDFWEHHTPLAWFLYAPFTLLSDSPGVDVIILMRWVQVPVWIAVFWLAYVWMRNAGVSRFGRWAAIAIACSSSFLMNPAVEFRLDPLACAFFMGALVLWQRGTSRAMFGAGVLFGLAGLTNMRLIPLIVLSALFLSIIDAREQAWKGNRRATWIFAGGIVSVAAMILYFVATSSLSQFMRSAGVENYIGDKYAQMVIGGFPHRLLALFGVRVLGSDRLFEPAGIDVGGIAIFLLGVAGLVLALRRWRKPDDLVVMAVLQVCSLVIIAAMNFVYVYHFEIVIIMMLPLIASVIERIPRRGIVFAILFVAWGVNFFASIFRGKEHDKAYQDLVMRELHARTKPGETVFAGMPWALRREPAYRFWFLPDMVRILVFRGEAQPYFVDDLVNKPPAAVVMDHSVFVWVTYVQRRLAPVIVHNYMPLWSNVWIPAMNVRLRPNQKFTWVVPRDGDYRLFASNQLGKHLWFRDPFYVAAEFTNPNAVRRTLVLKDPVTSADLHWFVDEKPANVDRVIRLRKGQQIAAGYTGTEPIGIILLPGNDTVLFKHPTGGAELEASSSRITHVPQFGVRVDR